MSVYGTEIGPVSYNPENQRFEALVTLHEGADRLRIPTSLALPIDTDSNVVMHALIRQAKEHRSLSRIKLTSKLRAPASDEIARLAARHTGEEHRAA